MGARWDSARLCGASMYDAHIHLTDPTYEAIEDDIAASMNALDIVAFCVSTSIADSERTIDLARRRNKVAAFVGIHPEFASEDASSIGKIVSAEADVICGIGEIGLDPTVDVPGGYGRQSDVFSSMLALAESHGLPTSIHSRKSLDDVLEMIPSYKIRASLLHWFDGSRRQLAQAMDMGLYVSYGPVSVYAADKRVLMSHTDPARMLVETDGPVRFSKCFERTPAQPCHVPSVIHCAAETLGVTYEDMRHQLAENSQRYLGIQEHA